MITVSATEKEFHVTIPREAVDEQSLDIFLRWLEFDALARTSQMSEEQADQLGDEIKADWWARNKARFIPAEAR